MSAGGARALAENGLRALLQADARRLRETALLAGLPIGLVWASPSYLCVALHRIAHWLHVRGWRTTARLVWHFNLVSTGADISPNSSLGAGLVVLHPVAVTLYGDAGVDLTVEGWGGLGGGMDPEDVGAGPGLPVLGDRVRIARGSMVLGPVRIGDHVTIGPGCTVVRDVPNETEIESHPVRIRRRSTASGEQ